MGFRIPRRPRRKEELAGSSAGVRVLVGEFVGDGKQGWKKFSQIGDNFVGISSEFLILTPNRSYMYLILRQISLICPNFALILLGIQCRLLLDPNLQFGPSDF